MATIPQSEDFHTFLLTSAMLIETAPYLGLVAKANTLHYLNKKEENFIRSSYLCQSLKSYLRSIYSTVVF